MPSVVLTTSLSSSMIADEGLVRGDVGPLPEILNPLVAQRLLGSLVGDLAQPARCDTGKRLEVVRAGCPRVRLRRRRWRRARQPRRSRPDPGSQGPEASRGKSRPTPGSRRSAGPPRSTESPEPSGSRQHGEEADPALMRSVRSQTSPFLLAVGVLPRGRPEPENTRSGIRTRTPPEGQRLLRPRRLPFRHPGNRIVKGRPEDTEIFFRERYICVATVLSVSSRSSPPAYQSQGEPWKHQLSAMQHVGVY